jgi:hypothetical protein
MGRYWSLEDCCWVEYSAEAAVPAEAMRAERDPVVSEQVPEQAAPSQREPAFR